MPAEYRTTELESAIIMAALDLYVSFWVNKGNTELAAKASAMMDEIAWGTVLLVNEDEA